MSNPTYGSHLKDPWSFISSFNTISSVMCLSLRLVTRIRFHLENLELHTSINQAKTECRCTRHQSESAGAGVGTWRWSHLIGWRSDRESLSIKPWIRTQVKLSRRWTYRFWFFFSAIPISKSSSRIASSRAGWPASVSSQPHEHQTLRSDLFYTTLSIINELAIWHAYLATQFGIRSNKYVFGN